jgi:hypothetical protein
MMKLNRGGMLAASLLLALFFCAGALCAQQDPGQSAPAEQ